MKRAVMILFVVIISFTLMLATGCAPQAKKTGFLSDYSRLKPVDDGLGYVNMERLEDYDKFIIEPVTTHMHEKSDELDMKSQRELENYMHNALVGAIRDPYKVVAQPAPGVARVRVALTEVEKSTPALNVLPQTKLIGAGIGGASLEFEMVDSQTDEQIGAAILSQKGKRLSMSGLSKYGDAEAVMDDWAKRLRKRLDEAHGQ